MLDFISFFLNSLCLYDGHCSLLDVCWIYSDEKCRKCETKEKVLFRATSLLLSSYYIEFLQRKSRIISPAIVVLLATVYLLWSVIIGQQYLLVIFLVPLFYALIALKSLSKMFEDEADAKTRNRPNPIQTVQNVQQIKEMYQLIWTDPNLSYFN